MSAPTRDFPAPLREASVAPDVLDLRPDYAVLLVVAEGLRGGPSDAASDSALEEAERTVRTMLEHVPLGEIPQVVEWRDAYRSFGVKPQRARSSVEALLRRAANGLPRIDRLTDLYNAVSAIRLLPIGGEDLARYDGPPRLVRATGEEPFETVADGEPVIDVPAPGEVAWRDDAGITCRRWNWRQCRRTLLTTSTTSALFILDGLAATGVEGLLEAGADLTARLEAADPGVKVASRLITRSTDRPVA